MSERVTRMKRKEARREVQAQYDGLMKSRYGLILGREICKRRAWSFFCILSVALNIALAVIIIF